MKLENLPSISTLQAKVLHDPNTMEKLFQDFSINITELFRDPGFYVAIREKVIPYLRSLPFIRIWHAGCSTGEEAYSMAILLHEEDLYKKSIIYATDMNEKVIQIAKEGIFSQNKIESYSTNYKLAGGQKDLSEYFSVGEKGPIFHPFLSENIVFAQHNLVTDGSFNEFHIIICRNVLIYFNKHLQNHVHKLLYDSLSESGYLCLGNKEETRYTKYAQSYREVDSNEKLYQKI